MKLFKKEDLSDGNESIDELKKQLRMKNAEILFLKHELEINDHLDTRIFSAAYWIFAVCIFSLVFWKLTGVIFLNPIVAILFGAISVVIFFMARAVRNERLERESKEKRPFNDNT